MAHVFREMAVRNLNRVLAKCRAPLRYTVPVLMSKYRHTSSDVLSKEELKVAESVLSTISESKQCAQAAVLIETEPCTLKAGEWGRSSQRCGALAVKLGMTQLWTKDGNSHAVTLLQIVDNEVVMIRRKEREGYWALQLGAVNHPKLKNVSKPLLGQFKKANVTPKRVLQEFRVSQDALLPVGTPITAAHFIAGQFVDVCGTSIGKGFQGVMKRHRMKGQPASHGVTKTHRKMGATGGGQDPGRIWPGKKMAGRMGGKRSTAQCLKVYRVNLQYNVLYVKGPVPGHTNSIVRVTDAKRKPCPIAAPFPAPHPSEWCEGCEECYSEEIHKPHKPALAFPDQRKK